ncbi:MAG: GNAT family N-acetyltransferase, partial [Actinobacteria bacterium]
YAAYDDSGEVIGSVRVVPDGDLGLPLEHCLPLNGFRDGKRLAEISRLAVGAQHRGSRLPALLMKAGYQRCLHLSVSHIMLDTFVGGDDATSLYDRMGFIPLSDPYLDPSYDCGEHVLSLSLSVEDAHRELPALHPGLFRFFTSPDPVIDHG